MRAFQSTPPVKAATASAATASTETEFQSTPPVKAATRTETGGGHKTCISIHAAREGGDIKLDYNVAFFINFNPRRP